MKWNEFYFKAEYATTKQSPHETHSSHLQFHWTTQVFASLLRISKGTVCEMNFATTITCEHFYLEKLSVAPVAITKHTKLLQFGPVPSVSMVAGFKLVCKVGKRRDGEFIFGNPMEDPFYSSLKWIIGLVFRPDNDDFIGSRFHMLNTRATMKQ